MTLQERILTAVHISWTLSTHLWKDDEDLILQHHLYHMQSVLQSQRTCRHSHEAKLGSHQLLVQSQRKNIGVPFLEYLSAGCCVEAFSQ